MTILDRVADRVGPGLDRVLRVIKPQVDRVGPGGPGYFESYAGACAHTGSQIRQQWQSTRSTRSRRRETSLHLRFSWTGFEPGSPVHFSAVAHPTKDSP